jgi:uncharacterized protein YhaN
MRLAGWQVEGFGVLAGCHVEQLPPGLSVVAGANEAGKSTLLDFLRGVLFGFPDRRSRLPAHEPLRGGRHGGRVQLLDEAGRSWSLARYVGSRAPEIAGPDGRPASDADLRDLLGGADGALFRSVFAFGLGELASFATLDSDAVRDAVFAAGVLGAGRSATNAARALRQRREQLARPRQGDAPANRLLARLGELDDELRAVRRAAHSYPRLAAEQQRLAAAVVAAREDLDRLRRRRDELDRLLSCWPVRCRADGARDELSELGPLSARQAALLGAESTIHRLCAERSGHAERLAREQQLSSQLAGIERERAQLLGALGPALAQRADSRGTGGSVAALAADAAALLDAQRVSGAACEAAAAERERAREEWRAVELEGDPAWQGPCGPRPLAELDELESLAVELADEVAARDRLRSERVAAEQAERLARLAEAGRRPAGLPEALAAALGLLAVALCVLAALSALRRDVVVAGVAAALALSVGAGALAAAAARRRARAAASGDAQAGGGDVLSGQLAAVTARVDALAVPLGLEPDTTPAAVAAVAGRLRGERSARAAADAHARQVARARAALDAAEDRLRLRRAELDELGARCAELCAAAALPATLGAAGLVRALTCLEQLADLDAARQRIAAPLEQLRADTASVEAEVWALAGALPDAPPARGASAMDELLALDVELRRAVEHQELVMKAQRSLEESEGELTRLLGAGPDAEAVREALGVGDVIGWERARDDVAAALDRAAAGHEAAVATHRDAERELEQLERSGSLAELELRRQGVLCELERTLEEWTVLSLGEALLAGTLARYERERQPQVVARAAELFSTVTAGRYVGLVARGAAGARAPGIDALGADGSRVDCASLSRGTAEQLYLCLRLAYATTFAERGVALPIVLDDVLVNFDPDRARAVAGIVAEVARTHQVLAFTCHPHVVEVLAAAEPATRVITLAS